MPSLVDIEELRNVRGLQADRQTNEHTDGYVMYNIKSEKLTMYIVNIPPFLLLE